MQDIRIIDPTLMHYWTTQTHRPYHAGYYAMYSSLLDGIITDPTLMLVPVDDHLVHRGDGVFETIKCVHGNIYCLKPHLDRLCASARKISLFPAWTQTDLTDIVVQTTRAGGRQDCLVRILLSRGPGGFGVNPYECEQPALYVIIYELKSSFMEAHPQGAKARRSQLTPKPPFFANVKSCNYLLNVLMKKEAVDNGVDFTFGFDEQNHLAEGATENVGIVTSDRILCVPKPDHILAGTTMSRILDLSKSLISQGLLRQTSTTDITLDMINHCAEMLVLGTTPDVTAVTEFEGHPVGHGTPGPVYKELSALLQNDIRTNPATLTPVFF